MDYSLFLKSNQYFLVPLFQSEYMKNIKYIQQLLNDISILQLSDGKDYIYDALGIVEDLEGRLNYEFDIINEEEHVTPFLVEGSDTWSILIYKNQVIVKHVYDDLITTCLTTDLVKILKKYLFLLENKIFIKNAFFDKLRAKLNAIRNLSQSRPLLIREQIELFFLEKIQAADSLAALQSIENELNNTATDVDLIQKLLKSIENKKVLY